MLKLSSLLVMVVLVVSMEFHGTLAVERLVGDSFGWNIPNSEFFFDVWGINQGVKHVNDVLVFNFTTGVHNVAVVSLSAHDRCDGSNPYQLYTDGPAYVPLKFPGLYCFISTIGSDCKSFMRMVLRAENEDNNTALELPN